MSSFRFKQFEVQNSASAMKVGTDAVLLGAWMDILPSDRNLLEIGAGTGVISLMAAQRSIHRPIQPDNNPSMEGENPTMAEQRSATGGGLHDADYQGFPKGPSCNSSKLQGCIELQEFTDPHPRAEITAVEIDGLSCSEAEGNFGASPWGSRLKCVNSSIQEYVDSHPEHCGSFDIVFTNPPFFIDSLKAPEGRRSNARHTDTLSHEDILSAAAHLLKPGGRLALILPSEEAEEFIHTAALFHIGRGLRCEFHLTRLCKVHTTPQKAPKRYMMEFSTSSTPIPYMENHLYIQDGPSFTEEYKSLTRDFYLKF